MIAERNQLLQKPSGVEDLLPSKINQYRFLEQKILDTFKLWGYNEVSVPVLEYPEIFTLNKGQDFQGKMFQLSDETGRSVALRPDFTPSIARLIATHYYHEPLPIRLCYGGRVFRSNYGRMSTKKELHQAGVELVGTNSTASDAEIVAMAADVLNELGIKEFVICVGNINFIDQLLSKFGLSTEDKNQIKQTLNGKDLVNFTEVINNLSLTDEEKQLLLEIPEMRGGQDELETIKEKLKALQINDVILELEEIFSILTGFGLEDKVKFDLSLVRKMEYYTGFIMEAYSKGVGFPLCGGGRYDNLMSLHGLDLSATGFAFSFDSLLKLIPQNSLRENGSIYFSYDPPERDEALKYLQDLRQNKKRVKMDLEGASLDEALERAKALDAKELYYYKAGKLKKLSL